MLVQLNWKKQTCDNDDDDDDDHKMQFNPYLKGRIDTDATWKYELLERGILSDMTLAFTKVLIPFFFFFSFLVSVSNNFDFFAAWLLKHEISLITKRCRISLRSL